MTGIKFRVKEMAGKNSKEQKYRDKVQIIGQISGGKFKEKTAHSNLDSLENGGKKSKKKILNSLENGAKKMKGKKIARQNSNNWANIRGKIEGKNGTLKLN